MNIGTPKPPTQARRFDKIRLQPYVSQAATLGVTGCNPMCDGLQPYVRQARLFDKCLKSITFTMVSVEAGT